MFATLTKMKVLAAAAIAATGIVAGAPQASAHDNFSFGLSFGVPVYTAPAPVYAAPVYAPAPVYAAPACPAPVVVAPAPTIVYAPAPIYYRPAPVYYHGGWDRHGWDHWHH